VPVPHNPDPSPITYVDLRRMLDAFRSDLATAETTLAGISDEQVALELRLARIRLDLTGNNQSREPLIDILKRLIGPNFRLRGDNPDFLVRFDRGDVAWLRAYCHLLMATIDFQLAFDLERGFHLTMDELFANPLHRFEGTQQEKWQRQAELALRFTVREPARLGHFRRHMLKVCELNRETWKFIRAEQDDHYEWLPNPRQKGVIELPVSDEMIDSWLTMVAEVEGVLEGKKIIPASMAQFIYPAAKKGISLKAVLDDPPDVFDWDNLREKGIAAKYQAESGQDVNLLAFLRVMNAFQNSLAVAYAVWFN